MYGRLLLVDLNWPLFDVPMSIGIELTMLWNIFEVPTLCPKKQESMYFMNKHESSLLKFILSSYRVLFRLFFDVATDT